MTEPTHLASPADVVDEPSLGVRPSSRPARARSKERSGTLATEVTKVFLEHPLLICSLLVIATWTIRQLVLHYTVSPLPASVNGNYISDQVGGENLIADWQAGFRQGSVVPADNFFLKYPLYLAVDNLPLGPLKQLFVASWVLLALTAVVILKAAELSFAPVASRLRAPNRLPLAMLVVALALAATPFVNYYWLEFQNSRNIEIALGFYLLARFYRYLIGESQGRSLWLHGLDIVLAAALFADDPLTLYVLCPPVVLVTALYSLRSAGSRDGLPLRRIGIALGSVAGAAAASLVVVRALDAVLPLQIVPAPTETVSASTFLSNLQYFVTYAIQMFGLTPWSVGLRGSFAWLTIAYGCLLIAAVLGCIWAWRREPGQPLGPFLAAIFTWLLAVFLLTELGVGGNDRELQFCVAVAAFALGLTVLYAPNVRVVAATIALASCALVLVLASSASSLLHERVSPNTSQFQTVTEIKSLHIHVGYAEYWDAGIDKFLSGESLDLINVECPDGSNPIYYNWESDKGMLDIRAGKSFYILSETDPNVCSRATLDKLLGAPSRVVAVADSSDPTEILVYDYNIGPRLFNGSGTAP